MHRRAFLATTTALAGLSGCVSGIGSPLDGTTTPAEPPYEPLAEPFCVTVENRDDQPHTLAVTVEIDDQSFDRTFDLDASEHVEDWCFDRPGRYSVVAETAGGERDARDLGEMEPGLSVSVGISETALVGISPPGHEN